MPGLDRSGPMGIGPMTGGRRGLCGRTGGRMGRFVFGDGYGGGMGLRRRFGRGGGRGFGPTFEATSYPLVCRGFDYSMSHAEELEMLKADAKARRKALETIEQRIDELESEDSE